MKAETPASTKAWIEGVLLWSSRTDNIPNRPLHGAAHLEHLLQHVAARVFQIDQDDVGVDRVDASKQACPVPSIRATLIWPASRSSILQDGGADRILVISP